MKVNFRGSFYSIALGPPPLMLPALSWREPECKECRAQASHISAHLSPLHLFLHRTSDFLYTPFSSKLFLHVQSLPGIHMFLPPLLFLQQIIFSYSFHPSVQGHTFSSALPSLCFSIYLSIPLPSQTGTRGFIPRVFQVLLDL